MGLRFRYNGCLYNAYVKDSKLTVAFMPWLTVEQPLPFVKEDFMISHTYPISNVALLLESDSGNLLIAWFTGGRSIYKPEAGKLRLMAHTNFNINVFRDSVIEVLETGVVKNQLQTHITRTHLYPLNTYFIKGNPNWAILDIPDEQCGFVMDVRKNPVIVKKLITGGENYPGFLRMGKSLVEIGNDSGVLVDPYIIEQPVVGDYTYNL